MESQKINEILNQLNIINTKLCSLEQKLDHILLSPQNNIKNTKTNHTETYSLDVYLNSLEFKESDLDQITTFDMIYFAIKLIEKHKNIPLIYYQKKNNDFLQ